MTKRTRLKILVLLLVSLAVVFLAAITFTWESAAVSRAVLGALSGPDLRVDAAAVRINVLRGVLLRDVTVKARLEGGNLDLKAAELQLSHRLWRLLAGELAIEEIVFKKPEVALIWDAPKKPVKGKNKVADEPAPAPAEKPAAEPSSLALAMSIQRLALEDGIFAMSEAGAPEEMVRFEGLDFELGQLQVAPGAASLVAGLSAQGRIVADKFFGSGVIAEGVEGALAIGESRVQVTQLMLPIEFGTIVIPQLDLDLGRDPYFFALAGGGDPLVTARLLGAASGFGNGKLEFEITGDGSPKGGPRGRGSLAVAGGKLGEMPVLASLELLLAGTGIIGRPYEPFVIPFRLDDGDKVTLEPFVLVAGSLQLRTYGRVDLAGPLDLHLEVSLPREDVTVKEIPREVLEALTDVDGRVKLPILIAGTIDQPALRFDSRAWAGLAGRRLAAEALKRLFGS